MQNQKRQNFRENVKLSTLTGKNVIRRFIVLWIRLEIYQ